MDLRGKKVFERFRGEQFRRDISKFVSSWLCTLLIGVCGRCANLHLQIALCSLDLEALNKATLKWGAMYGRRCLCVIKIPNPKFYINNRFAIYLFFTWFIGQSYTNRVWITLSLRTKPKGLVDRQIEYIPERYYIITKCGVCLPSKLPTFNIIIISDYRICRPWWNK